MDYLLIITDPTAGRNDTACATMTDVQNLLVNYVRHTTETNYVIEVRTVL